MHQVVVPMLGDGGFWQPLGRFKLQLRLGDERRRSHLVQVERSEQEALTHRAIGLALFVVETKSKRDFEIVGGGAKGPAEGGAP